MSLRDIYARNLRKYRLEAKLSQEALAQEAGVDRTYISALERSVYSASIDMIERLASVLDVEASLFLERPGRAKR